MPTTKEREQDVLKIKQVKNYDVRVQLLHEIAPRYGVRIYEAENGKNIRNQLKSAFVRECPTHGKEEVKMQAFMRGNFGCPKCARQAQSEMFAQLRK